MIQLEFDKAVRPEARLCRRIYPADTTFLFKFISEFVILNYYFFAFKQPQMWRDQIISDIAINSIEKISLYLKSWRS